MATQFEQYKYHIPTIYLSAIINGDYSGLSDSEEKELNDFLATLPGTGHWAVLENDESYFSRWNDVNKLGCDVTEMIWNEIISQ